jgi:excisionase family DNA binding protein
MACRERLHCAIAKSRYLAKVSKNLGPELVTMKEAAEMARVTRQRISQAAREGKLPFIPFGLRCIRFYRQDVERWIENKRQGVPPGPVYARKPSGLVRQKSHGKKRQELDLQSNQA